VPTCHHSRLVRNKYKIQSYACDSLVDYIPSAVRRQRLAAPGRPDMTSRRVTSMSMAQRLQYCWHHLAQSSASVQRTSSPPDWQNSITSQCRTCTLAPPSGPWSDLFCEKDIALYTINFSHLLSRDVRKTIHTPEFCLLSGVYLYKKLCCVHICKIRRMHLPRRLR